MDNYISRDGKTLGPFTDVQMLHMMECEDVLATDLLWIQSQNEWVNALAEMRKRMARPAPFKRKAVTSNAGKFIVAGITAVALGVLFAASPEKIAPGIAGVLLLAAGVGLYLLPAIVAAKRNHRNLLAIILIDLFLGWTLIGWVVALVWAVYQEKK